jgi:hypothetical protein
MVCDGTLQEMLTAGNRVEIVVDQLPEALELSVRDWGVSVYRDANRVRIDTDITQKRALTEMLWAGGCDVVSLTPMKSSLEDMFLKLLEGGGTN